MTPMCSKLLVANILLVFLLGPQSICAEPVGIRVNQTPHPLDGYAIAALRVALANQDEDYKVVVAEDQITLARAVDDLEQDSMDVMWMPADAAVEARLLPIRFPLLKGLLGHRICIINPAEQGTFDRVETMDDLKRLTFGQGQGWSDVEILKSNGLNVVTTSKYQNLFYMVEGGRFDGFPRGVMEPWAEIASRPELDLVVEKRVVLIYRLPFYLFVRKDERHLANKIMQGFETALKNGSFDEFFYNNNLVKDALTRSNLSGRAAFHLHNPALTPETPLEREDYWLDLESL